VDGRTVLTRDDAALLFSMLPFYQHPNVMRRGGVISVLKYYKVTALPAMGARCLIDVPTTASRAALHLQELLF